MDYRINFLYEAIKDAQGTIRALDFKANALLVTMALVVTNIQRFADAAQHIRASTDRLSALATPLVCIAVVTWLIAVTSAFLALRSRSDIDRKVQAGTATGVFWAAPKNASLTPQQRAEGIPTSEDGVANELAFEHLKLAFIRSEKTKFTKYAFDAGFATLVLLMALWILSAVTS